MITKDKRKLSTVLVESFFSSLDQREGNVHHVGEVVLALFGGGDFSREDVVGDGADAQGTIA